jgi:hypothetical protein
MANLLPLPDENKCRIREHVEFNTVDGLMTIAERARSSADEQRTQRGNYAIRSG